MARSGTWLLVLGLSVSLAGCALKRISHEPGLVTQQGRVAAAPMANPPELSLTLHRRHLEFGHPSSFSPAKWWWKRQIRKQLKDAMEDFPFLARAQFDNPDAPYRLVIEATYAIRGSKTRSMIHKTSRQVIPTSERGVMEVDAKLYRGETLLNTYEAVGQYKIRRHLLFMLSPMSWTSHVAGNTLEDTFRDLFLQMQQDVPSLFAGR